MSKKFVSSTSHQSIAQEIERLLTQTAFIDFHESHLFSLQLRNLLENINTLAETDDLFDAVEILEALLRGLDSILNRVDDSSGEIGDTLRGAAELWIELATNLRSRQPEARKWIETVLSFFDNNDFGIFDTFISHSGRLLCEEELRQLAWRFESDAKRALKRSTRTTHNREVSHACLGLRSVGKALKDIRLIEKSLLLNCPSPNTLQLSKMVLLAIEFDALDRADHWLAQPAWREDPSRRQALVNALLKKRGNIEQLKANLLEEFLGCPNELTLTAYLEFADPKESQSAMSEAVRLAEDHDDLHEAIAMLLLIDRVSQAAGILALHEAEVSGTHYSTLLKWLQAFEQAGETLATILCYRHLLMELLDRNHRKAYPYGANYFHRLLELDKQAPDYQSFGNAQAFIERLRKVHGRKQGFWGLIPDPNKPST